MQRGLAAKHYKMTFASHRKPLGRTFLLAAICCLLAQVCSVTAAGTTCSIRIRLSNVFAKTYLNLAEIALYDSSNTLLTGLTPVLSTTYGPGYEASNCVDGDTSTICHSRDGDLYPTLTVSYPCSTGRTSLAKVVITNRPDCCGDRITLFKLDFLDTAGLQDVPSYVFADQGIQSVYTIIPTAMCSVRIRLIAPFPPDAPEPPFLHLQEVLLYGTANPTIPIAGTSASLSSFYNDGSSTFPEQNCVDNNTATLCHSGNGDQDPSLRVFYPCPDGTSNTLASITIYNRNDYCGQFCTNRIVNFQLDFLDQIGAIDKPSYSFARPAGLLVYNIIPQPVSFSSCAHYTNIKGQEYISGVELTYDQCEDFCQKLQGHSASITSATENKAIVSHIKALPAACNKPTALWLGGRRTGPSTFSWEDGSPYKFTQSCQGDGKATTSVPGRRSLLATAPADCLAIRLQPTATCAIGTWRRDPCSVKHHCLCENPLRY